MNLIQLWNTFCGRPADEPFDPRRDLLKPRLNRLETCEVQPGLYHYLREAEGTNTRFHLRVDLGGSGVLLANATAAVRLRPSGAIIAKALLDGQDDPAIMAKLRNTFHGVSDRQAADDIQRVRSILRDLEAPGDNYPILNLADPTFGPGVAPLKKPLSADLPLAGPEVLVPILDRLWEEGIPHVTLIAPAGFERAALVRAVQHAEDLGMIAGVRARGTDLAEEAFVAELAAAGVDHVNLLYLSCNPAVHDAIAGAGDHQAVNRALNHVRSSEVCAVAEIGLIETTLDTLVETVEALKESEVTNLAFFALATDDPDAKDGALGAGQLLQTAGMIEEFADDMIHVSTANEPRPTSGRPANGPNGLTGRIILQADAKNVRHLWYPPVQRAAGLSLAEQVCQGPRTSGDHAIRVQCDGSVYVARGPWRAVGNILHDSWQTIAGNETCEAYRKRVQTDTHCHECPGLAICAADCPRTPTGWAVPPATAEEQP
jgi:radical SAM protein with 4Fe4S-binding SPASM domain